MVEEGSINPKASPKEGSPWLGKVFHLLLLLFFFVLFNLPIVSEFMSINVFS